MTLDRADVESALAQKGFTLEERDHRYYFFYHNGKKTAVSTKVSTGTAYKHLGDKLVSDMAHQMKLTTKQFGQFVECSMSGKDYVSALKVRGVIR